MRADQLESLPPDLRVPCDDGACDHLQGLAVPPIGLVATDGSVVRLDGFGTVHWRHTLVIRETRIERVFYPVFPSDRDAERVLAWLHC